MLYQIPDTLLAFIVFAGISLVLIPTGIVSRVGSIEFGDWLNSLNPQYRVAVITIGAILAVGGGWLMIGPSPPNDPEVLVRSYWEDVNGGDYESAWGKLSERFKCNTTKPCENGTGNFEAYVPQWESYEGVEVTQTYAAVVDDNRAHLKADLLYRLPDDRDAPVTGFVFCLVLARNKLVFREQWLIDRVTPTNCQDGDDVIPVPLAKKPRFSNLRFCEGPCEDGEGSSSFTGYTDEIWFAWDYDDMRDGVPYVREWWFDHDLWVRYSCGWEGGESGTFERSLFDRGGGLHGGEWELRIVIQGEVAYSGTVEIDDSNDYWDSVGDASRCRDWD